MVRPRSRSLALLVPVLLCVLVAVGCSTPPEQQLLQKYFQAVRMRDNVTLGNIATVIMSPEQDGMVQGFEILKTTPPQITTLKLKELAAAEAAARKDEEEFNKKKKEYQDANVKMIENVLKAERENKALRGKEAEVQTAWTKWREETQDHSRKVAEARKALAAERTLAEVSVFDARNPVDVTQFDGEQQVANLLIKARVKKGDAPAEDKELHVQLTQVKLTNGPEGRTVSGRWIVTHISEAADGKTPPM
jgi:hypothetical protein